MDNEKEIQRLADICKSWYGLANAQQRADGVCWYPNARAFCLELANTYRTHVVQVAGVVAALSPGVYWDLNRRQAEALVQAYATGGMKSARDVVLSTYGQQADKAYRILPLANKWTREIICGILGPKAWKTRAFFQGIITPGTKAVCIDRHMISALNFNDRWCGGNGRRRCYRLLADAVRQAAEALGVVPYVLQATIWCTFKEVANAYSLAEQGVQHDVRSAADLPV